MIIWKVLNLCRVKGYEGEEDVLNEQQIFITCKVEKLERSPEGSLLG